MPLTARPHWLMSHPKRPRQALQTSLQLPSAGLAGAAAGGCTGCTGAEAALSGAAGGASLPLPLPGSMTVDSERRPGRPVAMRARPGMPAAAAVTAAATTGGRVTEVSAACRLSGCCVT